ncbi:hypothetical protein pb186bvf_007628 [Paramecium bursaria]
MRTSTGRRNIQDLVPHQQVFGDVPNYQLMFKLPIDSRPRSIRNSFINKLPNFKANPISSPASPKDTSFWKTNNYFQTPTNDPKKSQHETRNSVSPQLLSINRNTFYDNRKVNARKYHLQMQVFNEQQQIDNTHLVSQRVSQRKDQSFEDNNQLFSPPSKRKTFKLRANSKLQDETKTLHQYSKSFQQEELINKNSFKFHFVLGKGGFGKVWKVELNKNKKLYAMKEMSKAKILSKKSVNSVMNERILLTSLQHPFIANIHFAFQDRENLYLVMDLLTGGDLRYHIGRQRRFSEQQTKFAIAALILALQYIHKNNIIHRDIKPENIVLDRKGYPRLTDFGVARIVKPENSQETSGTPGYMAPEVMCRQNHSFGVDHYALGVMGFEFMMGRRPYVGKSRKEIRDAIMSKQIQIKKNEVPIAWTQEAADFFNQMIQRKPNARLGYNGTEEIQCHPWFNQFPWKQLYDKQLPSPFVAASKQEDQDFQREISSDHDSQDQLIQENALLLRRDSIQNQFLNYPYNDRQISQKETGSTNATLLQERRNKSKEYK